MRRQNVKFIEELDPVRKRRMITKYQSLSGLLPSKKNEEYVWFESSLERDFAILLEANKKVSHYVEQPLTLEYYNEGKILHYTPDFLVYFIEDDQSPWLCEIKYRTELREKFYKYKSKFRAAYEYCQKEGYEFKIFSDLDIRTPYLENINFLDRYCLNGLDNSCYDLVLRTLSELGNCTPKEIMLTVQDAPYNMKGRCLYALWYGVKIGDIGCDLTDTKINMNSEIWLPNPLNFKTNRP